MTVAERLKAFRGEMPLDALSAATGISVVTLRSYEEGHVVPTLEAMLVLCRVLDFSLFDIRKRRAA